MSIDMSEAATIGPAVTPRSILENLTARHSDLISGLVEIVSAPPDPNERRKTLRAIQGAFVAWMLYPDRTGREQSSPLRSRTRYGKTILQATKETLDEGIATAVRDEDTQALAYLANEDRLYDRARSDAQRNPNDPDILTREKAARIGALVAIAAQLHNTAT
jgi:hypothetical protein